MSCCYNDLNMNQCCFVCFHVLSTISRFPLSLFKMQISKMTQRVHCQQPTAQRYAIDRVRDAELAEVLSKTYRRKRPAAGSWDRFASADQKILAVSMRRKECAVGRETDSVSELLYGGRFTAQISSLNTIPDIQLMNRIPLWKTYELRIFWCGLLSRFFGLCGVFAPTFYSPDVKTK